MDNDAAAMARKPAKIALVFVGASVFLALLVVGLAGLKNGEAGVRHIANLGPCTNPWAFFAAGSNLGLLVAALLTFTALGKLTRENAAGLLVFLALSLLYMSFAREHVHYGDMQDYLDAAQAVATGAPLPPRYVYPPLWATALARMWCLGGDPAVKFTCFFTNQFFLIWSIPLFIALISRVTKTAASAAIITAALLVVNVPVIRNIVYVQINFFVLFLVLLASLSARKTPIISAALLTLAIHLKVFPLLFIPAFIVPWKKRGWLAFGIWMAAVSGGLVYLDGAGYFQDFMHNLSGWSPNPFRSSSITGFVSNSLGFAGMSRAAPIIAKLLTLPFIVLIFIAGRRLWQTSDRENGIGQDQLTVKMLGLLMFLFPLLSPTVWVHHLIFLVFPAAILLVYVRDQRETIACFLALAAVFFVPVFDWYPWSYTRMIGWLTLLVLYALIVPKRSATNRMSRLSFPQCLHTPS